MWTGQKFTDMATSYFNLISLSIVENGASPFCTSYLVCSVYLYDSKRRQFHYKGFVLTFVGLLSVSFRNVSGFFLVLQCLLSIHQDKS